MISRGLLLAMTVVLFGCSITSKPVGTRLHLLEDGAADRAAGPAEVAITLGLGPVTVAGYLDRPQLLRRESDSELSLMEHDHWAEPLASQLMRVLHARLEELLGPGTVVEFPWRGAEAPPRWVELAVDRFEPRWDGVVLLAARWLIRTDSAPGTWYQSRIEEPLAGSGPQEAVAAQSRAVQRLAGDIAAALR